MATESECPFNLGFLDLILKLVLKLFEKSKMMGIDNNRKLSWKQ